MMHSLAMVIMFSGAIQETLPSDKPFECKPVVSQDFDEENSLGS